MPLAPQSHVDRMFRAFSDPIRLRILHLVAEDELCVCDLVEILKLPQPTVSRHLSYLRRAGLVGAREERSWNFYRLTPPKTRFHRKLLDCLGSCVTDVPALRVDSHDLPTIMGNYDDGVGFDRDECGCAYREPRDKQLGDRSFEWTKAQVTPENKAFLRTLTPEIRVTADNKRVLLVHGSPRRLNEYLFEDRPLSSFQRLAASSNADIIVFGHTHKPYVKEVDGVTFLNVGSIGKPKDGDWRACYAVLEMGSNQTAVFHRVTYDVGKAAAAIRASHLPDEFAADIETGGAPRPVAIR